MTTDMSCSTSSTLAVVVHPRADDLRQPMAFQRIEARRRLVQQNQAELAGLGPGQLDHAPLTGGETGHPTAREVFQPTPGDGLLDRLRMRMRSPRRARGGGRSCGR